jgi:hypothetical protein
LLIQVKLKPKKNASSGERLQKLDMTMDVRRTNRKLTNPELKEVMIIENSHASEWAWMN